MLSSYSEAEVIRINYQESTLNLTEDPSIATLKTFFLYREDRVRRQLVPYTAP